MSSKSQTKAFFLCLFFGCLGFHRFYVGKIFTGLLWLVTLGFCGIGVIIDLFNILIGNFTDNYGLKLVAKNSSVDGMYGSKEQNSFREQNDSKGQNSFREQNDSKEQNGSREPNHSKEQKDVKNEEKIIYSSIKDNPNIAKSICLIKKTGTTDLAFFCPVCSASIFCHSVLIDKLGDLTKFIIISLYEKHSLEEVSELTKMGDVIISEEIDYLIKGGLVSDDRESLTELGLQYGKLLTTFKKLSKGIPVSYNMFTRMFEDIQAEYIDNPEPGHVIECQSIDVLSRNDNYANSLNIAINSIKSDVPFSKEVKDSLYSTVRIDRNDIRYIKIRIREINEGLSNPPDVPYVEVKIPYDRVTYIPRYSWVDPYRDVAENIVDIGEKHGDILSNKGKQLIDAIGEEKIAKKIVRDINMTSGDIYSRRSDLVEPLDSESPFILNEQIIQIGLNESCKGVTLEEVQRKKLCQIRYYPFYVMEVW